MTHSPVIVWFRQDLGVADNPALHAAWKSGQPVAPIYVLDDQTPGSWRMGGASRWWLHGSLSELQQTLATLGAPLVLRRVVAAEAIPGLARETGAGAVYWNRLVEPFWWRAEQDLDRRLRSAGVETRAFAGSFLFEPGSLVNRQGAPFRVFTPFWKACLAAGAPATPLPAPDRLPGLDPAPQSEALASGRLLPTKPDWAGGLRETWQPGERHGLARLRAVVDGNLRAYGRERDRPEPSVTSRLSPYLHFGEVSPRHVWRAVRHRMDADPSATSDGWAYLKELGWREFYANVLFDNPSLPEEPLQPEFADFAWENDRTALKRWQRGLTGYPIVDAGMRQL